MRFCWTEDVARVIEAHSEGITVPDIVKILYPGMTDPVDSREARYRTINQCSRLKKSGRILADKVDGEKWSVFVPVEVRL